MREITYTAVVYREEGDTFFVAQCPEVGSVSQGAAVEEAVANLKEATELWLEENQVPVMHDTCVVTFSVEVGEE